MNINIKYGFAKFPLKILCQRYCLKKGSFTAFSSMFANQLKVQMNEAKDMENKQTISVRCVFFFFIICINAVCLLLLNSAIFRFQIIKTGNGWHGMANNNDIRCIYIQSTNWMLYAVRCMYCVFRFGFAFWVTSFLTWFCLFCMNLVIWCIK